MTPPKLDFVPGDVCFYVSGHGKCNTAIITRVVIEYVQDGITADTRPDHTGRYPLRETITHHVGDYIVYPFHTAAEAIAESYR